jgi:hypothetical protein
MAQDKHLKEMVERLHALEIEQSKIATRVNDIHHALMGNGRPGMIQEFTEVRGGLKMTKFLATSGVLGAVCSLLIALI